jgi:hypothetical protein
MLLRHRLNETVAPILVGLSLLGAASTAAGAQVRAGVQLGIVAGSDLLRDSIVNSITLRPNTALFAGFKLDTEIDAHFRVGATVRVSRSEVVSQSPGDTNNIATLTVWHPGATLSRQLSRWIAAEASVGALIYRPDRRTGTIFSEGAPIEPVVGLALSGTRRLGRAALISLDLGYDAHRFSTQRLKTVGFTGKTTVHRVSLSITLRRAFGE